MYFRAKLISTWEASASSKWKVSNSKICVLVHFLFFFFSSIVFDICSRYSSNFFLYIYKLIRKIKEINTLMKWDAFINTLCVPLFASKSKILSLQRDFRFINLIIIISLKAETFEHLLRIFLRNKRHSDRPRRIMRYGRRNILIYLELKASFTQLNYRHWS